MSKLKSKNDRIENKRSSSKRRLTVEPLKAKDTGNADRQRSAIIFPGPASKPESKMSPIEKMERSNVGISKTELETLKTRAGIDYDKLAKLLSVTRATLINKTGSEKFSNTLSERIIGLADIYSYGYEVFEDEATFNEWMFRRNIALGGVAPYEICNNQFGREEVKNIIGRIEYGVYS